MCWSKSSLRPWILIKQPEWPESQESQELPEVSPPHPPQATSTTSPTTTTLTPEELELMRQHRATTRESSPAKEPRTDQGWEEFLTALSAKDVELSDLDFGLQQELRSSPQPRADFLALNLLSRSTSLRPWQGKLRKIDLTKKRHFTDLQQVETPTLEHPWAVQHSHSDQHHGYQIEDIGMHDWQQSTPTSRATSYRIYNEQPRLEYPSTWRTRTQSSTWTFHNYSAALPSIPDRHRSHHRCTSMQKSHYTKTMPPLWLPPPHQQEREELLPADPRFFIWVDQYPPVRLHSGWAYQLHQQLLGMDPYTNNELAHLVAYWQFAHIFQRRPKDKSQLQIPNRGQRQYHSFTGHSPRGTVHIRILDPKQPVIVDFKLFYSTDKIVVVTVSCIVFSTPSMDGPHLAYSIRLCKLAAFPKEPLSSTFSYTVLLAPKLK